MVRVSPVVAYPSRHTHRDRKRQKRRDRRGAIIDDEHAEADAAGLLKRFLAANGTFAVNVHGLLIDSRPATTPETHHVAGMKITELAAHSFTAPVMAET